MKREEHIAEFLRQYGIDLDDPDVKRTPERVTELFTELLSSVGQDPPTFSSFEVDTHDVVAVRDVPFRSLCVHHLVPFFGTIDIAVAPNDRAAGFGSFIRAVEFVCRKPQLQERLTAEIADIVEKELDPKGVFVRTRARQMCVELRSGVEAEYVATAARGLFKNAAERVGLFEDDD